MRFVRLFIGVKSNRKGEIGQRDWGMLFRGNNTRYSFTTSGVPIDKGLTKTIRSKKQVIIQAAVGSTIICRERWVNRYWVLECVCKRAYSWLLSSTSQSCAVQEGCHREIVRRRRDSKGTTSSVASAPWPAAHWHHFLRLQIRWNY